MDAMHVEAQELSALSWDGGVSSHNVASALSMLLPLLPLDCRARAACVCRAWRAAAAHPDLWDELRFERCAAHVTDAALASLCARAGAALRRKEGHSAVAARQHPHRREPTCGASCWCAGMPGPHR
jgi:hypothetical protein